jgi:hypothetical protein
VDNDRLSQQGARGQFEGIIGDSVNAEFFLGSSNYGSSFGGDVYASAYVEYEQSDWAVGIPYLIDGYSADEGVPEVGDEEAWGIDIWWRFLGDRELSVEYARLEEHVNRTTASHPENPDPEAIKALVDVWNDDDLRLTGIYTTVDPEYDIIYSSIHPYFERLAKPGVPVVPWERWMYRTLALPNADIWGVSGNWDASWSASDSIDFLYYDLDAKSDRWAPAPWDRICYDQLMKVSYERQITDDLKTSLTYARQEGEGCSCPDVVELLQLRGELSF